MNCDLIKSTPQSLPSNPPLSSYQLCVLLLLLLLYFMCASVLSVCVSVHCGACLVPPRGRKSTKDIPELEDRLVSHHTGAENQARVLWESTEPPPQTPLIYYSLNPLGLASVCRGTELSTGGSTGRLSGPASLKKNVSVCPSSPSSSATPSYCHGSPSSHKLGLGPT